MRHPRFSHHAVYSPTPPSGASITREVPQSVGAGKNNTFTLCKLFGDKVPKHLCELRRKELNNKADFSCTGCPIDVMLTLQKHSAKGAHEN